VYNDPAWRRFPALTLAQRVYQDVLLVLSWRATLSKSSSRIDFLSVFRHAVLGSVHGVVLIPSSKVLAPVTPL
jgi:hypothetical protein